MSKKIQLGESNFFVQETDMSSNYSNVSKMFAFLSNIKIPDAPIILDIGANIGIYSLSYASLFKNSNIYSFEPVNSIYQELINNININSNFTKRIHAFNFGFSDNCKSMSLSIPTSEQHERYRHNNNCGLFSIHGKGDNTVDAKFITLDSFMLERGSPNFVDFIKIDVEGHEFEVLKGAENTITKCKPIIVMEFNELTRTLSQHSHESFSIFFKKHNYDLFGLEYGWKGLVPLENLKDVSNISDLVAIYDH